MKVSLITTVLNEEKTIGEFVDSVYGQTRMPDEIIIVDAESTDNTVKIVQSLKLKVQSKSLKFKVLVIPGNRSVGRNEAVRNATGDIIVCTDGDCILDTGWVKNIVKPFEDTNIDVVAGYYQGKADTIFQKCLIPYVLVMEDRVDKERFLPSSRSMAFRKSIWGKVGGFPEELAYSEDYLFAKRLKKIGVKIVFISKAIVYWRPRENLQEAFVMFFNFARGDMEAGIVRPKVVLVFLRYFLGISLLFFVLFFRSFFLFMILLMACLGYVGWSILKNHRYVKDTRAFVWLPALQITSDSAVLLGSLMGAGKRVWDMRKRQ